MGICSSVASSEIEETQDSHENVVFIDETARCKGFPRLASLHSQQGNKAQNQDAAILYQGFGREDRVFCGVFDGHGMNGHMVSQAVRNRLPSLLLEQRTALAYDDYGYHNDKFDVELVSTNTFDEWRRACVSSFKVMDKELKLQNFDCSCSGTTAVTIIKQGEDLVIANLGDSRAVLGTISHNDELMAVQLTTDLKPNLPNEAERIRKSNGRIFALKDEPHVQRVWLPNDDFPGLAMTRAFGDFQLKIYGIIAIPQISYCRLTNKDQFLVLATDGVWDVLSNDQVASIVWSAESEEAAAQAVVDAAVAAWRSTFPSLRWDDCTVVCIFLQERRQQHHLLPKES